MAKKGRPRKDKNKVQLRETGTSVTLTSKAMSLLDVLREPSSAGLTVVEICTRAGIDRVTYYKYFKNPEFVAAVRQECLGAVYGGLLPTVQRVIIGAMDKDEKNPHWAKMVLQMGKMIDETKDAMPPTIKFVVNFERPKVVIDPIEEAIEIN